ncbi:MAG: hypothetical protein Q9183_004931, partial [Haloplaca sp. 2 TL-2023]
PLKFRVGSTKEPCGESNVRLSGQKLPLEWDGGHGLGSGFLDALDFLPNIFTTWYISCLEEVSSLTGGNTRDTDPIQVAQFGIYNHGPGRTEAAGFAVSFRSSKPEILRLVPVWTEHKDILDSPEIWRTPSMALSAPSSHSQTTPSGEDAEDDRKSDSEQKSLKAHLQKVQSFLGTTFEKARQTFESWCPTHKQARLGTSSSEDGSSGIRKLGNETRSVEDDETATPTTGISGTNPHALPTRSATPSQSSFGLIASDGSHHIGLKVLGLVLILCSLVIWIALRCRDPRIRAEIATRREERRNKRLYRQAARRQKIKRWFCSWRHRGHQCTPASTWDEKRARVIQQEEVLEEVMKEDLRKLSSRNRVRNHIDAAERGSSLYMYDSDDSRRRSRETLPGYESEGTQPPSYDQEVSGSVTRVADGFRYVSAEREDTPDSSVISTSPRTSRDERDSDFGKDFEPLSLGTAVAPV